MHKSALAALGFLGLASATSSTTSLWLFGLFSEEDSIVGSVIGSDATATTYTLDCADKADCDLPTPFIYTQGPSTAAYSHTLAQASGLTETFEIGCAVTSSASGVCSITIHVGIGSMVSTTTTTSFSDASALAQTVTITGGQSVQSSAATITAPYNSTATYVSGGSFVGTATSLTTSLADGATSTSTSLSKAATGSPISSVGGGAMITQAPWVMGMAVGVALAAM